MRLSYTVVPYVTVIMHVLHM